MKEYRIYDNWTESIFINRPNRFTITAKKDDKIISAYLPNTGRLEEHLIPGNSIFLTKINTPRFNYKVVSSFYQDSFVFLDTVMLNRVFEKFVTEGAIKDFKKPVILCREYSVENRRFDFLIRDGFHNRNLIEIKSCTFCHNNTAMFPDAPGKRALSHISLLSTLFEAGYKPWIIFLISHNAAERFIPNLHTDPAFTKALISLNNLNINTFKYNMPDPVTIDIDSIKKVNLNIETAKKNLTKSGSYLLILENRSDEKIEIGHLGKVSFKKGYYVYIGSAMNGLDQRVKRHYRFRKNKRWHIDYICPEPMQIIKDFKIRRIDRLEDKIAKRVMLISDNYIPNFGSSDSAVDSHLFFFKDSPLQDPRFIKTIFDYWTFTDK